MTSLAELLVDLQGFDPKLPLVFVTKEGEIGAGYHVTELRYARTKGIDCGGTIADGHEARLQLLDGAGSHPMRVGKFCEILAKSLSALPELSKAPLAVEFGHGNQDLRILSVGEAAPQQEAVVLPLGNARAICKPAQRSYSLARGNSPCCAESDKPSALAPCCASSAGSPNVDACCA